MSRDVRDGKYVGSDDTLKEGASSIRSWVSECEPVCAARQP
jgi:hypothetical protein